MLTGERRPVTGRRGMTVLGKVPKPVNLPSQRLENRGLDPNVEIVPRGSVSWGTAGSPPTSANPWGNSTQSTSPPVSSGPWGGAPPRPSTAGSSGSAAPSSGPGTVSAGVPWGGHPPRPSSAGSGTRPSSAGSLRQTQTQTPHQPPSQAQPQAQPQPQFQPQPQLQEPAAAAVSAWGPATARPSSASGVLGQAQPPSPAVRPRSAETRTLSAQAPALTRFAEQTNGPAAPTTGAWGAPGAPRRLGDEPHQPSRFTLTRVDFPTLGSEKNPDLRPQQKKTVGTAGDRAASLDERVPPTEERPPSAPTSPYEEPPPTSPGAYAGQERVPDGWRREGRPYGGHSGMAEGTWHRDGPAPMQSYGGSQPQAADTWRRESGHGAAPGGGPSDDNWRRSGPPVGPYGPPGPGRFQPDPGFMHQQRYGPSPGPGPYGRSGGPGPGGYGRHGDMYGNAAPFGRQGGVAPPRPGPPPMGPGMYQQGPGPYDNYYGPPGPGYGNMDEREMMMLGMNGPPGMYGNYPQGPPGEPFGRFSHGGPGSGPRHMPNNMGMNRDRNDSMGYEGEGYRDGSKHKDNAANLKDGAGHKDGYNKEGGPYKEGGRSSYQDPGESRRGGQVMSSNLTSELQRPSSRGGHHGNHIDWGAAASSDEPMDFSKPVFEEDISSASPGPFNKTSSSELDVARDTMKSESKSADISKTEVPSESPTEKVVDTGVTKDSDVVQAPKSGNLSEGDHVQTRRQKEVESGPSVSKVRVENISAVEIKDQVAKKIHGSEGSDAPSSEKLWGRQHSRERSFGRDRVSAPHGGGRAGGNRREINGSPSGVIPSPTTAMRPGSSHSRQTTPSLTQVSMSSATDILVKEEVISPPVEEKHMQSSDPTSPSGSDGQKSNDKLRILKRAGDGPDSPHSDILNINETAPTEAPLSLTAEAPVRDDTKLKGRALNNHDGEKEWRPKALPVVDTPVEGPRPSSATAHPKQPTSRPSSSGGAPGSTEKAGVDAGNPSNDSYDYEAQRARMKEIAAQRAIQLRKEEDERIKEQKAKALAKLEELNRRSLVASVSPLAEEVIFDEPSEEPPAAASASVIVVTEEVVITEVVVEEVQVVEHSGGETGASTPRGSVRNGRNEHGKRERVGDRKRERAEHRVKMGPGEQRESTKARAAASASQIKSEPPLLSPSPKAHTPQAPLTSVATGHAAPVQQDVRVPSPETGGPPGASQVQQQIPPKAQETRHRGKQSASQLRQAARQPPPSLEVDYPTPHAQVAAVSDSTGWNSPPLEMDPKDGGLGLGSTGSTNEGAVAGRKKKPKNGGRNKQKVEGLTVSTESSSIVDPYREWNIDLSSSNESGTEAGKPTPKVVLIDGGVDAKPVPISVSQKDVVRQDLKSEPVASEQSTAIESAGNDGGLLRSNGEIPNKRPQRKSQLARERRVPARDRGTSQDVRVGDKPHGGEGMIWAPVRSPSGPHPAGSKGGFGPESIAVPETAVVEKREETVAPPPTGGRARRAELERYTPKPVVKQQAQQQQQEELQHHQPAPSAVSQPQASEPATVPSIPELSQNSSSVSDIKFGSEARQADTSSKQSRAHPSWRQRSSGSERVSAHKETNPVQQSESVETGGKPHQPASNNTNSQQNYHRSRPQSASSEQSRPGSSHQAREAGRSHSSTSAAEKEQQKVEAPQQGRSSHSQAPTPAPAATEREAKIAPEGVTPYQPPRPGSGQKNRGLDTDGQSSHEHVRSHRSNTSQADRQHGAPGKFDRDHHGSHERGSGHQQSRSQSYRHQHSSHDRDQSQAHSGSHQQPRSAPAQQPSAPEVRPITPREKEKHNSRSASQSVLEKYVSTEKEQSHTDHVETPPQPRSPPRQRGRAQVAAAHDRDQAPAPHGHQHSRYRQPGHERDHQREVPNAVHHHQHQRGTSDGHWQQTGGTPVERTHPSTDLGHSNEHSTRSTFHKSQNAPAGGSLDKDYPHSSSQQQHSSRSDPQNKPVPAESLKQQQHPQYQPVSQHQRPQQQGSGGAKVDNTHNSSHWNGERAGSPPAQRAREHGQSRRGRFGGRYSGPGRGGDIEHRREQMPRRERLAMDAAAGAVPSQVGG